MPKPPDTGFEHGIPFMQSLGATLVEWGPEHAQFALAIAPRHLNRSGVVHGGVYAVLADAACGLSGCYSNDPAQPRRAYTLSLTTSFLGAAAKGTLHALGKLRRRGRRIYFATVEITGDEGELLALGEGSFMYHNNPDGAVPSPAPPTR
ncbi:MAG: PaaI family thioesterase [Betaproteobacteria bacterium]